MLEGESNEIRQSPLEKKFPGPGREPSAGGRLLTATTEGANALACALVVLMALAFGYEVSARYLFDDPTGFVNQFAAYSMPIITFLGAARTLRINGHVSVDIVTTRLPPRLRARIAAVMDSLSVVVLALVTIFASMTVLESYSYGTRSFATAVTFPEFIPQIVMPVGLLLLLLEQLRLTVLAWRRAKSNLVPEMNDEITSIERKAEP